MWLIFLIFIRVSKEVCIVYYHLGYVVRVLDKVNKIISKNQLALASHESLMLETMALSSRIILWWCVLSYIYSQLSIYEQTLLGYGVLYD